MFSGLTKKCIKTLTFHLPVSRSVQARLFLFLFFVNWQEATPSAVESFTKTSRGHKTIFSQALAANLLLRSAPHPFLSPLVGTEIFIGGKSTLEMECRFWPTENAISCFSKNTATTITTALLLFCFCCTIILEGKLVIKLRQKTTL